MQRAAPRRGRKQKLPPWFIPPTPALSPVHSWIVRELEEGGHESEFEYSNWSSFQSSQDGSAAQGLGQPHGRHKDLNSNHSSSLQLNERAQVIHFSKPWDLLLRDRIKGSCTHYIVPEQAKVWKELPQWASQVLKNASYHYYH